MLHDETRKLLIEAWNKTHNAKEIAECFSVNTSTVYRLEKQMRETGSIKTMTSQRGRKHALTPEDIQNIDRVVQQEPDITIDEIIDKLGLHVCNETVRKAVIIAIPENNAIKTVQHFPVFRALQECISCIVFWDYKRKIGWGVKKQIWIISQL